MAYAVQTINPVVDPAWDEFVNQHPLGWICHLSAWQQVLEKSFKHIRGRFFVRRDERTHQIKAGLPVYAVNSWLLGKRLVSIPFATVCDPLISSPDDMAAFLPPLIELQRTGGFQHVEIRTLHAADAAAADGKLGRVDYYRHHYLELDRSRAELKKAFHRTCVRQRISLAGKSDFAVQRANSEADLDRFYVLYLKTRCRLGLPPQPRRFIRNLWQTFYPAARLDLWLAQKGGVDVAGLMCFKFKQRVSAEFSALDEMYLNLSPSHLLFWEAIQQAHAEGFAVFDFGRTACTNTGLMNFKSRWGTREAPMPQFVWPQEKAETCAGKETSKSYALVNKLCACCPETANRLMGEICYRHLG